MPCSTSGLASQVLLHYPGLVSQVLQMIDLHSQHARSHSTDFCHNTLRTSKKLASMCRLYTENNRFAKALHIRFSKGSSTKKSAACMS
jgi:hypothetical protein